MTGSILSSFLPIARRRPITPSKGMDQMASGKTNNFGARCDRFFCKRPICHATIFFFFAALYSALVTAMHPHGISSVFASAGDNAISAAASAAIAQPAESRALCFSAFMDHAANLDSGD